MERTAVLEQLEPMLKTKARNVVVNPGTRVIFRDPETAMIMPGKGGRGMDIKEDGIDNMLQFFNVPVGFRKTLKMSTLAQVNNELLSKKEAFMVITEDGLVTGFAKSGTYKPINFERALKTIDQAADGVDYNRAFPIDNKTVQLEVITAQEVPVHRGDLIKAGAMVQMSPLGITTPMVQSFAVVLACTNGATTNNVLDDFSYGSDGDGNLFSWLRKSVRKSFRAVQKIGEAWRKMGEENILPEERAMVLEAMIKEAKLPPEIAEAVRARAIANPPETAYDVMNHITYASSHLLEVPRDIIRAQRAVAQFNDESQHSRLCPVCHRAG